MWLGMSVFVAFFVLLILLAESIPPAASTVPLVGMSLTATVLSNVQKYSHATQQDAQRRWLKIQL